MTTTNVCPTCGARQHTYSEGTRLLMYLAAVVLIVGGGWFLYTAISVPPESVKPAVDCTTTGGEHYQHTVCE